MARSESLKQNALEEKITNSPARLAAKGARGVVLAAGVTFRLILCPGDDIALASSAAGVAANSKIEEAVLPTKDKMPEIVWEERKI